MPGGVRDMADDSLTLRLLAVLFPIFGIVAAGYFYGRRHKPEMAVANRLNMDVFVPALVFAAMGNLGPAAAAVERACANSQLFDNRWLQGMALYVYGIVHTFGDRLAAAEQALREAIQLEEFASDRPMHASALLFLGINAVAQGKLAEAHAVAAQVSPEMAEKSTIEVALLAGLFRGMLSLAAGDSPGAAATARQTRRRGEESGYLIYAAEAGQILQAVATPPALAQLPAFVCCQFEQSPAGQPTPSPVPLRSPLSS